MKTVVITGSARGFGYAMLEEFYKKDFNVVMCDINEEALATGLENLKKNEGKGKVLSYTVDVTNPDTINKMIESILKEVETIDIWINNAGVNQPEKNIWSLETGDINRLIDIDLKGTIYCSNAIMKVMEKQTSGAIYNVEGYGSNDATRTGLSIYGTSKRAVTYFTEALTKEVKDAKLNVCIGKITPGIMITNFISTALGDKEHIELSTETKNIAGDIAIMPRYDSGDFTA